jgi:hypothetical protein
MVQLPLLLVHSAGYGDQHEPGRVKGSRHVESNIMTSRAPAAIPCRFMQIHFPDTTGFCRVYDEVRNYFRPRAEDGARDLLREETAAVHWTVPEVARSILWV